MTPFNLSCRLHRLQGAGGLLHLHPKQTVLNGILGYTLILLNVFDLSRRVLVVEDAVHGLVAARAAGAFVVAVTNSLPRHVLTPYADLVVDCLDEIDLAVLAPSSGESSA